VIDEFCRNKVTDHRGAPAEAYVLAASGLAGPLDGFSRRCVNEVERRAPVHRDRRARVMGENEDRCVERRVGTPPARPFRILVPSWVTELSGAHDFGADPRTVLPQEGVVDAAAAAGLADHLVPPASGEHPFMQPIAGVPKRRVKAQAFAGAETVERDGEELDAGE
jgi:hypothetical protein